MSNINDVAPSTYGFDEYLQDKINNPDEMQLLLRNAFMKTKLIERFKIHSQDEFDDTDLMVIAWVISPEYTSEFGTAMISELLNTKNAVTKMLRLAISREYLSVARRLIEIFSKSAFGGLLCREALLDWLEESNHLIYSDLEYICPEEIYDVIKHFLKDESASLSEDHRKKLNHTVDHLH